MQLGLNAWTPLFLRLRTATFAAVDIAVLLVVLVVPTRNVLRRDRLAGWMLVAYVARVAFARALTLAAWLGNRALR